MQPVPETRLCASPATGSTTQLALIVLPDSPLLFWRGQLAIDKALEAKVLRYHLVEHWGVHTIATQLGIHHSTVDRVLSQAGRRKAAGSRPASIVEPYHPFIIETLQQYPKLTAARLYVMAVERGFEGGPSNFRAHVAQLRPRPAAEAYLRLKTLPGEQGITTPCRPTLPSQPSRSLQQHRAASRGNPDALLFLAAGP